MTTLARALQQNNWTITAALSVALLGLLALSPAEATLGNAVKLVYAHGAAERVAEYAYLIAGGLGLWSLRGMTDSHARWTRAVTETAIVFWLAQFMISLPAQIVAWGGLTWNEPRVIGAIWIGVLTPLVYAVARWIGDPSWMALAAVANAAIVLIVLRGAINILHPLDPIVGSDSTAIKFFYAAIVLVTGALAAQFARYRARVSTRGE
ncbi:MAG: hypothetical protein HY782_16645 [Chloroflexi bacterium]|nr:hypothetical protein [Chloroflexota bacterium]